MELAIEEIHKSLKYHRRQFNDNLWEIQSKEQAIKTLKTANEKHEEIITQLEQAIELIKKDNEL